MGGVVDTCIFISAERRGLSFGELLIQLSHVLPAQPLVASSVTAAELVQGIFQGDYVRAQGRRAFVTDVLDTLEIISFSKTTAWIAGRIRGEQARAGATLPIADSLIAATALELGYSLITQNVKDFSRISGLKVVAFTLP